MTPYEWLRITRNGQLPPPSLPRGPASPYFRFLPNSGQVGPSSPFPRQMALPAAQAPATSLAQQALTQAGPAALGTAGQVAQQALPSAAANAAVGPGTTPLALNAASGVDDAIAAAARAPRAANAGLLGAARTASAAAPAATAAAESAVASTAARQGLVASAMNAVKGVGLRGGLVRGGIPAAVGMIGGGMLDESNLLGGSESAANDYASKALKWGGVGAGIGTMITPGAGTLIGGGIGALIGLGQEGLERAGVLDAPTMNQQVARRVAEVDAIANEVGLPPQVLNELKRTFSAQMAFAEGDKTAMTALGESYAQQVQEAALMYAEDPQGFMAQMGMGQQQQGQSANDQLVLQAAMVDAVKPYADNFIAQSNATAQTLENMAAGAGDLAPMYTQQAAQQRAMGAQYAADLINQAQVTPYQQALQQQAQYLDQMSSNLVQQAMSQVMQPAASSGGAGSMDLTAIIDQYAGQMQPQ